MFVVRCLLEMSVKELLTWCNLQAKKQYEQRSLEAHTAEAAYSRAKQEQNSITTKEYDRVSLADEYLSCLAV